MSKNKTVVISDIHIGDDSDTCWYRTEVHEPYLAAVLQWVIDRRAEVRELIILGDLVDFWTYPPNKVPPTMQQIVDKNPNTLGPGGIFTEVLNALDGHVTYLRGNHDMSMTQEDLNRIGNSRHKIKLVPDVYIQDGVLYTHGHLDTLFNAPDSRAGRPYPPLPVGHFVTRALSFKLQTEGTRAVDLLAEGAPVEEENWLPWIWQELLDAPNKISSVTFKGVVASLLNYMSLYSDMSYIDIVSGLTIDREIPITLAGREEITLKEAITIYEDLCSDWWMEHSIEVGAADAGLMTLKSIQADKDGSYLGWFAQRRAMQAARSLVPPYLVVMGHTHTPKMGLHNASTDYLNTGFLCPSTKDMDEKGQHATFGVIEHAYDPYEALIYNRKFLYRVNKDTKVIEPHTAEAAKIAYPNKLGEDVSGDFSCYLELHNGSSQALNRIEVAADYGHYVVPPPPRVEPGSRVLFWLQDYPGLAGSAGRVTYAEEESGRLFTLSHRCTWAKFRIPWVYDNKNNASGGDALWTKSGDAEDFGPHVSEDGHPFFVNYEVKEWDGWTEWVGYTDVDNREHPFVVNIPNDTYLVGVQIRDQKGYGVVNLGFKGTTDIHQTGLDRTLRPDTPHSIDGFDGWVSGQSDVTTVVEHRCPPHTYIDAMMFAMVSGYGIVNVNCHHSDGSNSGWLTGNEPVHGSERAKVFPPRIQDGTWANAVNGRIRQIQVHEYGGDGIVDCRYQV